MMLAILFQVTFNIPHKESQVRVLRAESKNIWGECNKNYSSFAITFAEKSSNQTLNVCTCQLFRQ
jgi:hypothetical protein